MPEVLEVLKGIQKDFKEYKETNDAILEAKADGKATAELETKLTAIEKSIAGQEATKERLDQLETAMKRGVFGEGGKYGGDPEVVYKAEMAERSALVQKFMRSGDLDAKDRSRALELTQKFLSVQSNPDGGYWVLPDTSGRSVSRIFETSPMRTVAAVQNISTAVALFLTGALGGF